MFPSGIVQDLKSTKNVVILIKQAFIINTNPRKQYLVPYNEETNISRDENIKLHSLNVECV